MDKQFDILVAGEINPDLILSGDVTPEFGQKEKIIDSAALTIGSSSVIFACGATRLGLRVGFVGVCGADLFGHFMLDEMTHHGIDISFVRVDSARPTGLSVILDRSGDRSILTYPGTISSLKANEVTDEMLSQSRHLHVSSYFLQTALQPGLPDLFERARNLGLTISLDPNWDPTGEWANFDQLLPRVDVFFPNENEALALTTEATSAQALAALGRMAGTVAIKRGSLGAVAYQRTQTAIVEALPVQVVDTVGAGDSFDAGFLCGWLNGWSLAKSLRMGVVCGSLSTRAAGGTAAQPDLIEAMPYLT
ncbi:MAG: carbohydrate kinase [Chloroflexi bacterium RBG_13_50_21]|nr:MAG: carbohydrate kinase [Chloroflexi bacterium RBG_13_50_21]